jgi:PTH1 family peptidyl-tRNA hydrolase
MIELVTFLGNPGRDYARNRHNAGWLLADRLPCLSSAAWQKKYKGLYASADGAALLHGAGANDTGAAAGNAGATADGNAVDTKAAGTGEKAADTKMAAVPPKIHFLKPETFMNLSGEAVQAAATFFKIPPENILVVHDELDLLLGQCGLKFSGGLNGHNGLRSLKAGLGTADFWRLRIGIGRPANGDVYNWVLSDFAAAEQAGLDAVLAACADALTAALTQGPESLLPEWNKKKIN